MKDSRVKASRLLHKILCHDNRCSSLFYFHNETHFPAQMFFEKAKMEDDADSVDLIPKIQELHIIHIFGFDGKVERHKSTSFKTNSFVNCRKNSIESSSGPGAFDLRNRQQDLHSKHQDQQARVSLWSHAQYFNG